MKKTFILSVFLTTMFVVACKKKTTTPDPTPASTTTGGTTTGGTTTGGSAPMSYNDGSAITVDSANAVLYTANLGGGVMHREIDIYAFKAGKQVLEFHFLPKVDTQPVSADFNSAWLTYLTNGGAGLGDNYNGTSGNFNLSLCDTVANKLTGTFNFTGNNGSANKTISGGTITITKLTKQ